MLLFFGSQFDFEKLKAETESVLRKISVSLGYYSIYVWGYRNDVRSVNVFRYNTGKWNINILEKEEETVIKCFHKAADSEFDDALYTIHFVYFY